MGSKFFNFFHTLFFCLNESLLVVSKVDDFSTILGMVKIFANPWDPMGQELRYQREELRRDEL